MKRINLLFSLFLCTLSAHVQAMQPTASFNFSALPGDMRRTIQGFALSNIPEKHSKKSYKNLAHFIFVNKEFYAFANQPANTITLLSLWGDRVENDDELTTAIFLQGLPGIRSDAFQQWLKIRELQMEAEREIYHLYKYSADKKLEQLEKIKALGGNFNSRSHYTGRPPIISLVGQCRPQECLIPLLEKVISFGADINRPSKNGETAITAALTWDLSHTHIQGLLRLGADVNQTNGMLECPLILGAERNDHEQIIPLLVTAGANINAQDETGRTISMQLACDERYSALEVLLAHKPNCDIQDRDGETLLMKLIRLPESVKDDGRIINKVLDLNPNLALRNNAGKTVLDIALDPQEHREIAYMFCDGELDCYYKYQAIARAIQKKMLTQQAHNETD